MQTKLLTTSEVPIHQVFSDDSASSKALSDHQRSVMDDLVNILDSIAKSNI